MRLPVDESYDFAVVQVLREAGYDVLAVADAAPSAPDETVLELAVSERRVLLTEDKDFGRWVYADKRASAGVVLLRYPAKVRRTMPTAVVRLVEQHAERLAGCFAVVQPARVRISRPTDR